MASMHRHLHLEAALNDKYIYLYIFLYSLVSMIRYVLEISRGKDAPFLHSTVEFEPKKYRARRQGKK